MRISDWSSDVCSSDLAGFSEERLDALFVEFGQGFQSMTPALRDLESALLGGKVRHGNHPVLAMCAANAVVTPDPAGNRKLNKAKAAGRIDGKTGSASGRARVCECDEIAVGAGSFNKQKNQKKIE